MQQIYKHKVCIYKHEVCIYKHELNNEGIFKHGADIQI